jgi:hypothetical protein
VSLSHFAGTTATNLFSSGGFACGCAGKPGGGARGPGGTSGVGIVGDASGAMIEGPLSISVSWQSSAVWLSVVALSGELVLGCARALQVSCSSARIRLVLDIIGIVTSVGNHQTVSQNLFCLSVPNPDVMALVGVKDRHNVPAVKCMQ